MATTMGARLMLSENQAAAKCVIRSANLTLIQWEDVLVVLRLDQSTIMDGTSEGAPVHRHHDAARRLPMESPHA
jgi:hypothetical protein